MDGTLTVGVHDFDWMRQELQLSKDAPILETLNNMPADQAKPLWEKVNEMEFHFARLAKPMPHAENLLQTLANNGVQLAIITRNTLPAALETLRICNLLHFFPENLILDRDTHIPKPLPDGINWLIDHWQASTEDTVMVGDYLYDLQAGKAANVATIHIDANRNFNWPTYTDWAVSSFEEIIQFA